MDPPLIWEDVFTVLGVDEKIASHPDLEELPSP
jgi:hypothetical protein